HGYFPADNGRFFLVGGYNMIETESRDYATDLFDLDYLGRFHKKYQIEGGIHHEVVEKEPGGNLFVHGSSLDGHVEDIVLEIDRDSGERLRVFDLTEHFDDTRYTDAYDWAHMNSISYNRKENTMLLSARNVSSVIKIDWETEEILWILSDPKVWEDTPYAHLVLEPIGEPLWHYEQHAAFEIHEDIDQNPKTLDLMLFDNRVIRNELMDLSIEKQEDQSSVVQYAINEEDFTVEEKKRFSNSMAFITSNFEIYPALDLLMANHGSLRKSTDDPIDSMWGEIYEVDYSSKEILNTYALKHGFYRAHKIYPDAKASAAPMK
ncbi:MAG TPA: hypothetical protein DHN33_07180, partial [Eubacteriaceae bacterium]|nr:hypothetical protein [Eubacteriaceae bacterium]